MQFNFNIDQYSGFSAYANPMTTESSRETENRRLASLKSKQDIQALQTHMRNLALEQEAARNAELQAEEAEKVAARLRNDAEMRKKQVELRHKKASDFEAKTRMNSVQKQFTSDSFDDRLVSRKTEKKYFLANSVNDFVSRSNLADEEFRKQQVASRLNREEVFHKKNLELMNKELESMDSQRNLDRTNRSVSLEFARLVAMQKLAASQD